MAHLCTPERLLRNSCWRNSYVWKSKQARSGVIGGLLVRSPLQVGKQAHLRLSFACAGVHAPEELVTPQSDRPAACGRVIHGPHVF